MGGRVLELESEKLWKEGLQQGKQQGLQQGAVNYALSLYKRHKYDEDELFDELLDLGLSEDEARVLIEKNAPEESAPVRRKSMKL